MNEINRVIRILSCHLKNEVIFLFENCKNKHQVKTQELDCQNRSDKDIKTFNFCTARPSLSPHFMIYTSNFDEINKNPDVLKRHLAKHSSQIFKHACLHTRILNSDYNSFILNHFMWF